MEEQHPRNKESLRHLYDNVLPATLKVGAAELGRRSNFEVKFVVVRRRA